ncbi:sugar phosphate nucleotidyltransferase [Plantactinospora sp. KLBMP9567]|uniref:sugar phosphate nucleotidyltransferase n=1 Tax=Plantactinospora sp. KLBMP9567 TaxID=3085900 RepID=UPI0029824D57|nr:sugar phosphate nucleotidyltransferase [Plantactinospora sp. KLBMP9567]MDW5329535.1 sugar phosphate nucleotidyltransferase [Plantactinospora sp. KLBMP9567]
MHAIVLVGGKGTRLLPYTADRPKALLELGSHSVLEILVDRLRNAGAERITMCLAHLGDMIRAVFGDGTGHGVRIDYTTDPQPLGTAGPLRMVTAWDSPALIVNGDVLTTIDFADLYRTHRDNGNSLTVAAYRHRHPVALGVLDIADGQVTTIREKPEIDVDVSAGMYVADPTVRAHIPPGSPLDMPELIGNLLKAGTRVGAYHFGGDWHDIGRPESYAAAQRRFAENPHLFLASNGGPAAEARSTYGTGGKVTTMTEHPQPPAEPQIVEIVAQEMGSVLMRPPLQRDADFFRAGGDSLRAVELVTRLTDRWRPAGGEPADELRNALLLSIFDESSPVFLAQVISEHAGR